MMSVDRLGRLRSGDRVHGPRVAFVREARNNDKAVLRYMCVDLILRRGTREGHPVHIYQREIWRNETARLATTATPCTNSQRVMGCGGGCCGSGVGQRYSLPSGPRNSCAIFTASFHAAVSGTATERGPFVAGLFDSFVLVVGADTGWANQSSGLQQFAQTPNLRRDPGGHRGRYAQGFVDAAEIVEREPYGDSGPVVLPLFAEPVCQSRKSAQTHPRAQIRPLDNRSADALRI